MDKKGEQVVPRMRKGEAGAREAVEKFRKTMLNKFGSKEGVKRYYQVIGRRGGKKSRGGGFTNNSALAKLAAQKSVEAKRAKKAEERT